MSMIKKTFTFKKSKDNGELSGKEIEQEVPEFDWELFKKSSNAKLFVERAFNTSVQKLVRDVHLGKNGTTGIHLQSIESVIARSVKVTKAEIVEWCKARDWDSTGLKDKNRAKELLLEKLPRFSSSDYVFTDGKTRERIAEIIATVSDIKSDPIAEYLWVKLTQDSSVGQISADLL